jgi:hypothetical protein
MTKEFGKSKLTHASTSQREMKKMPNVEEDNVTGK